MIARVNDRRWRMWKIDTERGFERKCAKALGKTAIIGASPALTDDQRKNRQAFPRTKTDRRSARGEAREEKPKRRTKKTARSGHKNRSLPTPTEKSHWLGSRELFPPHPDTPIGHAYAPHHSRHASRSLHWLPACERLSRRGVGEAASLERVGRKRAAAYYRFAAHRRKTFLVRCIGTAKICCVFFFFVRSGRGL